MCQRHIDMVRSQIKKIADVGLPAVNFVALGG